MSEAVPPVPTPLVTAQIEPLTAALLADELRALLPGHWEELGVHREGMPLDPQYEEYITRDARGEVVYATLRADGRLVGYWIHFITPGLHYKSTLQATMDILYVKPEWRGHQGGRLLFETTRSELVRRGVKFWKVGSKDHTPIAKFLRWLGFEPYETWFSMWLGD